jgi:hypothetical protein
MGERVKGVKRDKKRKNISEIKKEKAKKDGER